MSEQTAAVGRTCRFLSHGERPESTPCGRSRRAAAVNTTGVPTSSIRREVGPSGSHIHAQLIGQSSAGKFGPALTADAFGHHACDEITEIRVLVGGANIVARLQIAHCRQHLRGRQVVRHVYPVVARQAGMMAEQIAHRDAVACDGVM